MNKVTIRSTGPSSTDVVIEIDGVPLDCCSKIVIDPIVADGIITASLTVLVDKLDLELDHAVMHAEAQHMTTPWNPGNILTRSKI